MKLNVDNLNEFDITIFGQPVIDHVINTQNPFRYGELMKICHVNSEGEIVFKEGSWIRTIENEQQYFFGMPLVYPGGEESLKLIPGKKPIVKRLEQNVIAPSEKVARLGKPIINIGGGGPNVLQILNQVFGNLSIQFIGAYSPMQGGTIDPSISFVLEMIPPLLQGASPRPKRDLRIAPIYDTVPINIVVEGMIGDSEDRGVLKSPFAERIIDEPFDPKGKAIMVNTVYSKTLAVNALCCSIEKGRFGVLALTESLCNNQDPFSREEKTWIRSFVRSKNIEVDFNQTKTLYDFILSKILPEGPAVLIMNELEFDHILNPKNETAIELANLPKDVQFPSNLKDKIRYDRSTKALIFKGGMSSEEKSTLLSLSENTVYKKAIEALFLKSALHPVTKQKRVRIMEGKLIHLDALLHGFQAIRNIQGKRKSKIYVTLGVHGSLCLDKNDVVHYSPVTVVEGLPNKGKNAIGDTFAAMILAGEYISNFIKRVETPYIISAAAAAADALFYSGFESVSPATIDEYLAKTVANYKDDAEKSNYHELGSLSNLKKEIGNLPLPGAPHIRLGDIERKAWFTLINSKGPRMIGHHSIMNKRVSYGVELLTLLSVNGTVR